MHYQHLSHETQRIAHTSWEWHTLPDTTSLNRMAKMVNSVTILLGSKNLDYPMPGWHGSHKFRPQNRKGESWSSNATTISLEPNENATHIVQPKVTRAGRPTASNRETSLALSRIPRRWPCCIAHSLLAGRTPTAIKPNEFSPAYTCSMNDFCTWMHHHVHNCWLEGCSDIFHIPFFPQIQHRSWKSNAVAIATPHIHFGFMGCMPSPPIAWPKHSS